jgi:hypothetical protein
MSKNNINDNNNNNNENKNKKNRSTVIKCTDFKLKLFDLI